MIEAELPDGTILEFPNGTSDAVIQQTVKQHLGVREEPAAPAIPDPVTPTLTVGQAPDADFLNAMGRAALVRFLGNAGAIPENVLRSLLPREEGFNPLTLIGKGVRATTGGAIDPIAAAPGARAAIEGSFSGENISAALRTPEQVGRAAASSGDLLGSLGRTPEIFARTQAQERAATSRLSEEAPVATGLGETAGDIATLLTGRAGLRAAGVLPDVAAIAPIVTRTAKTVVGRALQAFARSTKASGARALETGAEGALLAALRDSDPAEVATIGAGGQVVGDLALASFRRLARRPVSSLLGAVGLATMASLGLQQLTPGGLDRILPTLEEKNKEIILTLLLGGGVGALTGGRVKKGFFGPAFAELVDVTRRGALLSLLTSVSRDPVRTAPVIQKFSEDPDFFGAKARRLLERAVNSDKIDIRNTIDRLMKGPEFRKKFESLSP